MSRPAQPTHFPAHSTKKRAAQPAQPPSPDVAGWLHSGFGRFLLRCSCCVFYGMGLSIAEKVSYAA